jgi:hypothetical protein
MYMTVEYYVLVVGTYYTYMTVEYYVASRSYMYSTL